MQRGNVRLFTRHHLVELGKPTAEQLQTFFARMLQDAKTWKKPQPDYLRF